MSDASPTESAEPAADTPDLPADAAGWKSLVSSAPGKDLLKLVQRDKPRASRLLSGFRATPEAVKNPIVLSRVVDEAMRQPGFAREVADLAPANAPTPVPSPSEGRGESEAAEVAPLAETALAPVSPLPSEGEGTGVGALAGANNPKDARLREQIEKQRASLKEKDERIATLERDTTQTKRDLATLRGEMDTLRKAKDAAEAEATNLRRRAERDARREREEGKSAKAEEAKKPEPTPAAPTAPAAPPTVALPFEEALRRLLRRGKYTVVAEVCKEAIIGGGIKEAPAQARGGVHALYAAALYGQDEDERGADQDQRAVEAFLDAGAVSEAVESFTRILAQPTLLRNAIADDATLLRRLVALAERDNKIAVIQSSFLRLRIVSPQGFQLLLNSLTRRVGKRGAEIAASIAATAQQQQSGASGIGPDEAVTLPGTALSALSPRRLAEAAEAGDARLVLRVRDALAWLRYSGDVKQATLADALLAAVGEISRVAVLPYTTQPGTSPRCAVVDASNVARHNPDPLAMDATPRVNSLLLMRDFLLRRGFFPVVLIADATLRFHVDDKNAYLSLVERGVVRETAPNTSADETLIAETRERDATLITNDRLSEWGDAARRIERFGFTLSHTGVALLPQ